MDSSISLIQMPPSVIRTRRRQTRTGSSVVLNSEKLEKVLLLKQKVEAAAAIWKAWKLFLANLVFAIILGYRVRRTLCSRIARECSETIRDLRKVLSQSLRTHSITSEPRHVLTHIQGLLDTGMMLTDDFSFIKSIVKQLFTELNKFYVFVFAYCTFELHPKPGYWLLQYRSADKVVALKERPSRPRGASMDSVKILPSSIRRKSTSGASDTVMDLERSSISSKLETLQPPPPPSQNASSTSTPSASTSRRRSKQAHIQLDIIAADKLMPARKGPVLRDAAGAIEADRQPGIRVTMLLPSPPPQPSSSSSSINVSDNSSSSDASRVELRMVYQKARSFTEITLNPQWHTSFSLPLPCPKHLLPPESSLSPPQRQGLALTHTEEGEGVGGYSEVDPGLYRALLRWWAQGIIKIEIMDGDRFNENIFLGEVTLLLSTFLVPGAKGRERLEFSGSYSLSKSNALDRVSGSVKLHAYLHLPLRTASSTPAADTPPPPIPIESKEMATPSSAFTSVDASTAMDSSRGEENSSSMTYDEPASDVSVGAIDKPGHVIEGSVFCDDETISSSFEGMRGSVAEMHAASYSDSGRRPIDEEGNCREDSPRKNGEMEPIASPFLPPSQALETPEHVKSSCASSSVSAAASSSSTSSRRASLPPPFSASSPSSASASADKLSSFSNEDVAKRYRNMKSERQARLGDVAKCLESLTSMSLSLSSLTLPPDSVSKLRRPSIPAELSTEMSTEAESQLL